jgi:uroporphyrinogen-III synthase
VRRVVILRPEPGASATLARATEQGLHAIKLPLFEIVRLDWSPPSDISAFDGLLVSSANAIREAGAQLEQLKPLPVYAVGPATAEAAREAGFEVVQTGTAGLDRLAKSMEPGLRLLHLAGEDRIDPGAVRQSIIVVPVYRARMVEGVDPAPIGGSVVVVHSARAGARLAEIAPDRSSIAIAAISRAAAESCGTGWQEVAVAAEPADRALLALAARLCEKSGE